MRPDPTERSIKPPDVQACGSGDFRCDSCRWALPAAAVEIGRWATSHAMKLLALVLSLVTSPAFRVTAQDTVSVTGADLMHVPNYASASPSGLLSWTRLAPPDILFRLASLAALNLALYWLPIDYWTTYTPSGDDPDGGVLFHSMAFCPVSWVLGGLCYAQAWRVRQTVRHRAAFYIASSLLLLVVLSTLIPQVQFYVRMSRF